MGIDKVSGVARLHVHACTFRQSCELRHLDRDEEVKLTFAHFGRAVYQAQVLEHSIVNAMVIAQMPERGRITRQDIDAFMDRQFHHTLGKMLRELARFVEVPATLSQVLAEALTKRNWLAHGYFRDRAVEFTNSAGCRQMIDELDEALELFVTAGNSLEELVSLVRLRFGITDDAIAQEASVLATSATEQDKR